MKETTIDMDTTKYYFIDRLNELYNEITTTDYYNKLRASRSRFLEVAKIGLDFGILTRDDLKDYDDTELFRFSERSES